MMNQTRTRNNIPPSMKLEEALRQSEELHRIILTNISDSVFLTDNNGNFTFICPNVDNIFGYSFEEIYSMKNISTLIGDDIYDPEKLEKVSELRNVERIVRDKDGGNHIVLINIKKVNIKYGTRLFTCRDITEYTRVKDELAKNINNRKRIEKDLAIFFNLSADLFCIMDGNRFRKLNPAWGQTLGYQPEELKGKKVSEFIHSDDVDITLSLEKRMSPGSMINYENRYRHRDGTYRWISWNSTMSDTGQIHAVGRDITLKKKEEFEIKKRLMKYKLESGRTYLIKELTTIKLIEAFNELTGLNYPGVIISRKDRRTFVSLIIKPFEYYWISEKRGKDMIHPNLNNMEKKIERYDGEYAIIIDSLEYLIGKVGFGKVLSFVGHLREIAFFRNHIILIGLDHSYLNKREIAMLEKETLSLDSYPHLELSYGLHEILKAIYEMNSIGRKPTRTDLCRKLNISQPTMRKRISELITAGYILEARYGRSVVVEITDMGRNTFQR